ncbi:MAG TPA: hypothetical protein VF608_14175, partial [Thermoanaerobaculia bacterium]
MLSRIALSILTGLLFAFAFPGAGIGALAFIALAPLLIAIVKSRTAWQSFFSGWIAFTTAWLVMVPWVVRVMSHYGGLPYFTGVLIFIAMSLYLGLFGGLFAWIVFKLRLRERFLPWLAVPLAWAAIEYARTYLLTGFPWNLIATALINFPTLVQLDRFAGPY